MVVPSCSWEALAVQSMQIALGGCVGKGVLGEVCGGSQHKTGVEQRCWCEWRGCFVSVCGRRRGMCAHACAAHAGSMSSVPAAGPRREFGCVWESTHGSAWRDAALAECCVSEADACATCPARCVAEHTSCASLAARWQGPIWLWHLPVCWSWGHWRKLAFPGGALACARRRNVGFFYTAFSK